MYRRYASLFFIAGCASTDNELITLEIVHRYVEQMDKYYGNVCELDIIFNFQKAYFILDELLLAGEMQESSKKNVLRCISQEDSLEDMEVSLVMIFCLFFASIFTSPCLGRVRPGGLCGVCAVSMVVSHPTRNLNHVTCTRLISCFRQSGRRRCHQAHVEHGTLRIARQHQPLSQIP